MSFPDAIEQEKSPYLLPSYVMDQISVLDLRSSFNVSAQESVKEADGPDEIGFLGYPSAAFDKHKNRVVA